MPRRIRLQGRRAKRGPTSQVPSDVLLRHHPDLLRQRAAAPRPRVHDDRRRRDRAPHAPARRGRVLSDRHRRARRAGRRRRPARRGSSPRSWPTATPSASRRWRRSSRPPTTSSSAPPTEQHRRKVQEVLQRVHDNGYTYRGIYEGWYCPRCADFKVENEILEGNRCPIHEIELTPSRRRTGSSSSRRSRSRSSAVRRAAATS